MTVEDGRVTTGRKDSHVVDGDPEDVQEMDGTHVDVGHVVDDGCLEGGHVENDGCATVGRAVDGREDGDEAVVRSAQANMYWRDYYTVKFWKLALQRRECWIREHLRSCT